jgi:PPK2 family polyphosphate:nucleotide phosphotransferase
MRFNDLSLSQRVKRCREFTARYRIADGRKFQLSNLDPRDIGDLVAENKPEAKDLLVSGVETLAELQERIYAQDQWALLALFQAMDAAGKDSTIKHVMSGVNPQGCEVYAFKSPTSEDLDHDYLWRCLRRIPERGRIGIFNRSYYEEVLAVKVHPEFLAAQKVPQILIGKNIWEERYEDIRNVERYLTRNGIVICKFFLHLSKKEQKKRFLERLDIADKYWKFSGADLEERGFWKQYQEAYEDMIRATATDYAPWYVVPADNKWYSRLVVAAALIDALGSLDLRFPEVDEAQKAKLTAAREILQKE